MAVEKPEIKTYFGKCKCCFSYGYLRTMWEEYAFEEDTEIYGQMLTQCFDITWKMQSSEEEDQICEDCIWKLREAYTFKKQVMRCQDALELCDAEDMGVEFESEVDNENYVVEYLEEELLDCDKKSSDDEIVDYKKTSDVQSQDDDDDEDNAIYNDDDEDEDEDYVETQDSQAEENDNFAQSTLTPRKRSLPQKQGSDDSDTEAPKPKWPKKLPREERSRTYKQYSMDALKKAVEEVIAKRMNQKQAAKHYRVPRKTLSAKVKEVKTKSFEHVFPATEDVQFVRELKTVLSYINATPFRTRSNQSYCFYCMDRRVFLNPEDLRLHTTSLHPDRSHRLEAVLRPAWNNEIVKLDIKYIACIKCNKSLESWPDVLNHLNTFHQVKLNYQNKMIPYVLGDNKCALCAQEFSALMLLDAHMNLHYNNYVCGSCGDSFVNASRLKAHEKIHSIGHFPCPSCEKSFTLEKYMKKHVAVTHAGELKVKCHHCSELFKSEHQRQAHIVKLHNEHVEYITCELCGSMFNWMRHFMRHMKRKHGAGHSCVRCGQFFKTKKALVGHQVTHMGIMDYKCFVCHKKYYSKTSMKSHMKYIHKNINIAVRE